MTNNKRLYLGVWFQRTSLHLKEFRDFLSAKEGNNSLDKEKLKVVEEAAKIFEETLQIKLTKDEMYYIVSMI